MSNKTYNIAGTSKLDGVTPGCFPPLEKSRNVGSWWIQEVDRDGRRWPPLVWDWNPVQQGWNTHGQIATSDRVRTPHEFAGYKVLGEAIPPEWVF